MGLASQDTTALPVLAAYEAIVGLGAGAAPGRTPDGSKADLGAEARRMRAAFEARTGAFGPEDSWFESRSRAFWDDAVTAQGFAALAAPYLTEEFAAVGARFARAHRGLFVVDEVDRRGATLVDLWSGAELVVLHLDRAQADALEHAEGPMDARVVAGPDPGTLYVLPGVFHHAPDASDLVSQILDAARSRAMETAPVLDALLRMALVFERSSRVKAAFAYRVESLDRPAR